MEYKIKLSNHRKSIVEFIKKEALLVISAILAIGTSFLEAPRLEYIDFKVLILLFNLMIVVAAFKELKVLDKIATSLLKGCTNYKGITFILIFLTFFSAMVVTNDVALITFVPLTLIISKKANFKPLKVVVFQTLGANLGSALTPMGNPQNLFIYTYFNINTTEFFKITFPLVVISALFLTFIMVKERNESLRFQVEEPKIKNKGQVIIFSGLFLIILLSVFNLIDYRAAFIITVVTIGFINKSLFKEVDYSLLLTFVAFFIFIGNISSMEVVKTFMEGILASGKNTFISSILVSQFISNVPATMLISAFTTYYKELLLGVNIGGLGTLIASLASVISYKLYLKEYPEDGVLYIKKFTIYNVIGLVLITLIIYFVFIG